MLTLFLELSEIHSPTRSRERGFTLVELMVVVVIISVLATLGVYGVSRYIASSKTGEALQMIGSIKAAQESYKDETFQYKNVSTSLSSYYPNNSKPGQVKMMWGGAPDAIALNWRELGVQPNGPTLFVYSCVAGGATDTVVSAGTDITIGNWPTAATGTPWYVVKATANLDGDTAQDSVYVGTSFTTEIFSANEGE